MSVSLKFENGWNSGTKSLAVIAIPLRCWRNSKETPRRLPSCSQSSWVSYTVLTTQTKVSSKSGNPVKINRTCTFRVHRWRLAWCLQSCMYEMDVFCVCVSVLCTCGYSLCKCHNLGIMYSLAWLFLRMYSRRPRKQDPHNVHQIRKMLHFQTWRCYPSEKIWEHQDTLVTGSTIYVHPAFQHFLLAFSGPIILSNMESLFTKIWANTTWILRVQPSVSALESVVPKSWREKKNDMWLVFVTCELWIRSSNQTQINI